MSDQRTRFNAEVRTTKEQARETRMRLEAEGLSASSRLRKLYASLRDNLFQTTGGSKRLDGLSESLSRLGMIDELTALDELMATRSRKKRVYTKWYVDHTARSRMETFVARRDYTQATRTNLSKTERAVLFRGAIYQGDLQDAHELLLGAVANRESLDAFPDLEVFYCAGRLAIVTHWQGNDELTVSALQIMRCFLEQQEISTRPFDVGIDWLPADIGIDPYFIVTLASTGFPEIAESLWDRFFTAAQRDADRTQLCIHLAMAGETDRAQRIASQDSSGQGTPIWLYEPMCFYAASCGDVPAANRIADEMFTAIRARKVEDLRGSVALLYSFIQWMQQAGYHDLAQRAVALYIELADKRPVDSEDKSGWWLVGAAQPHFNEFRGLVPAEELCEFARRQYQFVSENIDRRKPRDLGRWQSALARLGVIPANLGALTFQHQIPFVISLVESGRQEEALRLYRPIADWAAKPLSADPDTPNNPGKVTRARYAIPQLGPYFGDVDLAMECIEKLEASDRRTDYRKNGGMDLDSQLNIRNPRSLAKAKGIDAATDWAESLTDEDKQLQACVVLLHLATEQVGIDSDYKRTPIALALNKIDPWHMVFPGGC